MINPTLQVEVENKVQQVLQAFIDGPQVGALERPPYHAKLLMP